MAQMVGDRRRREPLTREWLFSAVDTVPECGCWIWRGCKISGGYGTVGVGGKGSYKSVHRASYEIHHGEIPDGLVVMHKCDTPSCVNPDHLTVGTKGENNRDRRNKARCASKLNADQVISI